MNAELIRAADRWQRIWIGPINGTSGNEATVSRDDVDAARVMANHILESASDFDEHGEPLEVTAEFCREIGFKRNDSDLPDSDYWWWNCDGMIFDVQWWPATNETVVATSDDSVVVLRNPKRVALRNLLAALGG